MEAESVATILCTSKQTRFNIATPNYRELDIESLSIVVTSGAQSTTAKGRGKSKVRSEGTEILSNAKLRLKAGQRYALLGRNGTGKSSKCFFLHSYIYMCVCGYFVSLVDYRYCRCAVTNCLSALLKAIAEKLIPGIPEETRIAILQQTEVGDVRANEALPGSSSSPKANGERLVIEEVIEKATARSEVKREIDSPSIVSYPV